MRRLTTAAVVTALAATLVIAGPPAVAAPAATAAGGGHGVDFTGDGLPDVLARERGTGKLKVYPHSGTFGGTGTYPAAVTINLGWQSMRWIGAADVTGDGLADVVAIDSSWRMVVARHSGVFNGTSTLAPGLVVVGYNWHVNDLVSVIDHGDYDAILARRASDGKLFRYGNSGGLRGTATFDAPVLFEPGGLDAPARPDDVFIGMASVTRFDGPDDFVYITANGQLWTQDPYFHWTYLLGAGWSGVDSVVLTNLNGDSWPDIIAREKSTGNLLAYLNESGGPAGRTYVGPSVIGYGWQTNDVIA